MNPLPFKLKLAIDAALVALIIFSTWYFTSDHYQKKIVEIQLGMAEAVQTQLLANQQKLADYQKVVQQAEVEHEKQNDINSTLTEQLKRLRVNKICSSSLPGSTEASLDQNGRAGLFSEKENRAFEQLQQGDNADFARCDKLNIDARLFNASQ